MFLQLCTHYLEIRLLGVGNQVRETSGEQERDEQCEYLSHETHRAGSFMNIISVNTVTLRGSRYYFYVIDEDN